MRASCIAVQQACSWASFWAVTSRDEQTTDCGRPCGFDTGDRATCHHLVQPSFATRSAVKSVTSPRNARHNALAASWRAPSGQVDIQLLPTSWPSAAVPRAPQAARFRCVIAPLHEISLIESVLESAAIRAASEASKAWIRVCSPMPQAASPVSSVSTNPSANALALYDVRRAVRPYISLLDPLS